MTTKVEATRTLQKQGRCLVSCQTVAVDILKQLNFKKEIESTFQNLLIKEFKDTKGADRNSYVRRQTRPWPTK